MASSSDDEASRSSSSSSDEEEAEQLDSEDPQPERSAPQRTLSATHQNEQKQMQKARQEGNKAFQNQDYQTAIDKYSDAIKVGRRLLEAQSLNASSSRSRANSMDGQPSSAPIGDSASDKSLNEDLAALYSNRSAAFASQCRAYLARPATRSERGALYGFEPGHLAALALNDAQKAVELQPEWPKAYSRLGTALFLSERYLDAEAAYLKGLGIEPNNQGLKDGLAEVSKVLHEQDEEDDEQQAAAAGGAAGQGSQPSSSSAGQKATTTRKRPRTARVASATVDDYECTLCLKLLYEPVTTPCGHTFCRSCFARAMDHRNKCPCCRTVLHIGRDLPVTVTLKNILTKSFPQEYAERGAEEAQAQLAAAAVAAAGDTIIPNLPLFVMSTVMPGETMSLNIFEPRYRLLVRRAMEGNRRIGMAEVRGRTHELSPIVVEAEVIECVPQPDGRYYIELVGRRRVKVLEASELDGYRVAKGRVVTDKAPDAGSPEAQQLHSLCEEVGEKLDTLLGKLLEFSNTMGRGGRGARIRAMIEQAGPKPPVDKQEELSFWAGALAVTLSSTLDYDDRMRMLEMESSLERLNFVKEHLQALPIPGANTTGGTCSVM